MDVDQLAEIVETMVLQHAYPGYDVRSLRLGLPTAVVNAPVRVFRAALQNESTVVKLAALRWFWDRPGDAKRCIANISQVLGDADEWVRLEAVRTIGRIGTVEEALAVRVSDLLRDPDPEVRKAAAKTVGKLGCRAEPVIVALKVASGDPDTEVKWKAQKALRQLGAYLP